MIKDIEQLMDELSDVVRMKKDLQCQMDSIKAEELGIKEQLLKQMQKQHIDNLENALMLISYVNGFDKHIIDSKKLKKNFPEAFASCSTVQHIKPFVKVRYRDE